VLTLRANREAFQRYELLPKVLVDVAEVDLQCDILGKKSNLPIAVAPTGAVGCGWRGGDVAIARAAAAAGIPYIHLQEARLHDEPHRARAGRARALPDVARAGDEARDAGGPSLRR
jgi:(S)-mandelate dehydrogenase